MTRSYFFTLLLLLSHFLVVGQSGWKVCNSPVFLNRVDDLFMTSTQVGYAVCGDGKIVKSTDGGVNWSMIYSTDSAYFRSVEFINDQKGFVGGFPIRIANTNPSMNILQKTVDGGQTWQDLTLQIPVPARRGICGLAIADSNTIYGSGNWFQDTGYIIKSSDGGATWQYINMGVYASSIIDMHFINKDTGFVTGKGVLPLETGIILYTTDGGQNWTFKYQNTIANEYCWKIQRLTSKIYYASLEDATNVPAKGLKSTDGGMTWQIMQILSRKYYLEGIGFIDENKGWAGGDNNNSFETTDGGRTWKEISVCPFMNRVFRVNDTLVFATGDKIWKYTRAPYIPPFQPGFEYATMNCHPNPVKGKLSIDVKLSVSTQLLLLLCDNLGKRIQVIHNAYTNKGDLTFPFETSGLPAGMYYVVLKTHEGKKVEKIIITK